MQVSVWYCYDDEGGHPYYYSTETGECTYEKPADFDGEGKAPPAAVELLMKKAFKKTLDPDTQRALEKAKEAQRRAEADRDTRVNEGQEHWVECFDPGMWLCRFRAHCTPHVCFNTASHTPGFCVVFFNLATDTFYYYGSYSQEMTWDKPENYVMAAGKCLPTTPVCPMALISFAHKCSTKAA